MILEKLTQCVLENTKEVSYTEAIELTKYPNKNTLYIAADSIRKKFHGNKFDTCSIMNIRSGLCSEDCKWCAQSIKHKTNINIYPILDIDKVLDCAVKNHVKGINRFSLVTSGRKVEKNEILKISEIYKHIRKDTNGTSSINNTIERILQTKPLHLCASMGLIGKEEMLILKNAGVSRYHCNLETSPSFFSKLCSTHTFEEKKQTLLLAKECGLEICSGGIIGMGESMEQRIELAFELRSLGVKSVPMNILNPIKGTELENAIPLSEEEILTTIAIFRFVLPNAFIRFAGGRIKMSEELQRKALKTGINASVVGDLLTTAGTDIEKDFEMFKELGYEITKQKMEFPQKT